METPLIYGGIIGFLGISTSPWLHMVHQEEVFMKVSDFIHNGKWNIPKLLEVFGSVDVHDIISIRLSDNPDCLGWFEGPQGVYSAKATYYDIIKDRFSVSSFCAYFWKKLWISKLHQRHKILWWRLLSSCLSTRDVFASRFRLDIAFVVFVTIMSKSHHLMYLSTVILRGAFGLCPRWEVRC